MSQADRLWPGRGYKPGIDDSYIAEFERFPADQLDEAFQAARKAKVKRGNYDWLLNRLESPERYIPGRRQASSKKLDWDPDIGRLNADWLDQEEE